MKIKFQAQEDCFDAGKTTIISCEELSSIEPYSNVCDESYVVITCLDYRRYETWKEIFFVL